MKNAARTVKFEVYHRAAVEMQAAAARCFLAKPMNFDATLNQHPARGLQNNSG